jgi:hypothetical protein
MATYWYRHLLDQREAGVGEIYLDEVHCSPITLRGPLARLGGVLSTGLWVILLLDGWNPTAAVLDRTLSNDAHPDAEN